MTRKKIETPPPNSNESLLPTYQHQLFNLGNFFTQGKLWLKNLSPNNWVNISFIIGLIFFSICFIQTIPYGNFTDEYEQLTAGWFISQGLTPYQDFFSHHAPLPLFVGALPFIFPFLPADITTQRVLILVLLILFWITIYYFSERKWRIITTAVMMVTAFILPVFNLQMHLANTYSTIGLIGVLIVTLQVIESKKFPNGKQILLLSTLGAISFWSNISSIIGFVGIGIGWLALGHQNVIKSFFNNYIYFPLILIIWMILPIYFLLHSSLTSFFWSIFTYNTQYYFQFRLAENDIEKKYGPLFRQVNQFVTTFMEVIATTVDKTTLFIQSLIGSISIIKTANFSALPEYYQIVFDVYFSYLFSFSTVLILLPLGTFVFFLISQKWKYALLFCFLTFTFWFRDNELFHFGIIFLLSYVFLFHLIFILVKDDKKVISSAAIGLFFFSMIPIFSIRQKFFEDKQPNIDPNLLEISKYIQNTVVEPDTILIIDQDIVTYSLAKRLPASKYYFSYPWTLKVSDIEQDLIGTISSKKASLIQLDPELAKEFPAINNSVQDNYSELKNRPELFIRSLY